MAFLQSLKAKVNCKNISIGELRKDVPHSNRSMKNIDSKFGTAVICMLADPEGVGSINVFLPKAILMNNVDIEPYNLGVVLPVSLIYD